MLKLCATQPKVLAGDIIPLILLDAADADLREIAIRRKEQTQFLEAWGGMMIRNHLHQIECTQLDRPKVREDILRKTGGIGSEAVKLIGAMLHDKPEDKLSNWTNSIRLPSSIVTGAIGEALNIIKLGGDDYATMDGLMRETTGHDLITLAPELIATGLVLDWNQKGGAVKLSALGELVVQASKN